MAENEFRTISDLVEKTTSLDNDVLLIESSTSTNKITKQNLLKEINSKLNQKYDDIELNGNILSMKSNGVVKKTITLPNGGQVVEGHTHNNKIILDEITDLKINEWDGKAEKDHNHDDIYSKLEHTHSKSEINDLPNDIATETFVVNKIAEASLSGGSGLTAEQTNQLSVAYTHSQSTHISQNDINNAINNTLASQGGNIYVGTTKPTDNNIVLWIDTTESGGSETETKTLQSISATYTQGSNVVYPSTSINSLKSNLVVKANYSDNSQQTVTDYTLSGTLSEGTSTITVTYKEKTTTFNVTVSAGSEEVISGNITTDNLLVWLDGENGDNSSTTWNDKSGNGNNATISGFGMNAENSGFYNNALNNTLATYNSCKVSVPANVSKTDGYTIEVLLNKSSKVFSGYCVSQMPSSGSSNSFFFWDLSGGTLGTSGGLSYDISNLGLTHLTFVIEGSSASTNNIKIYVNGEFNSEKSYNLNDNNFETITLFNREAGDRAWSGSIYMFRAYSKPLTTEEITVNYNYENNKGRA